MKLTPLITEKAYAGAAQGVYIFRVPDAMSKPEIAKAVKDTWPVTVTGVRTARRPAKSRTRGQLTGVRPGFKKAIVQLKKGDKIEELAA